MGTIVVIPDDFKSALLKILSKSKGRWIDPDTLRGILEKDYENVTEATIVQTAYELKHDGSNIDIHSAGDYSIRLS